MIKKNKRGPVRPNRPGTQRDAGEAVPMAQKGDPISGEAINKEEII
ncbi:hypothetical protein [Bacilliculturomica massiliensis]|nr:hypothetical protein [Bacilliculturomica massiliensis]